MNRAGSSVRNLGNDDNYIGGIMKLISWNVNGIRACVNKGFTDAFNDLDADIFCIQESKVTAGQITLPLPGYHQYWHYADKKGYSGTAVFSRQPAMSEKYGIGIDEHDHEGRVITLEYQDFYLVNCYTPNSKRELERLDYRMVWEDDFQEYCRSLTEKKPIIICGDLNVAHEEIDLKNPKTNHNNAGFTDKEREKMTGFLSKGFIDSFRYLYPDRTDAYSWWSYMGHAREKNVGWRIDYFLCSEVLKDKIKEADIYPEIMGSDHCPIGLQMDI